MDDGTSTSTTQSTQKDNYEIILVATQDVDLNVLKSFLQIYMKLLRNNKVIQGLQELINSCAPKEVMQSEMCAMNNLHRHKKRTGKEMRLTKQIGEYDMDQVILDLGYDANTLSKQNWELMGKMKL